MAEVERDAVLIVQLMDSEEVLVVQSLGGRWMEFPTFRIQSKESEDELLCKKIADLGIVTGGEVLRLVSMGAVTSAEEPLLEIVYHLLIPAASRCSVREGSFTALRHINSNIPSRGTIQRNINHVLPRSMTRCGVTMREENGRTKIVIRTATPEIKKLDLGSLAVNKEAVVPYKVVLTSETPVLPKGRLVMMKGDEGMNDFQVDLPGTVVHVAESKLTPEIDIVMQALDLTLEPVSPNIVIPAPHIT